MSPVVSSALLLWDFGQHGQTVSCAWTAYIFSLLHLDTHSLASLIIFTVETLHWTRTTVHTISPTLYYCSFVPAKNRVLIPAHIMVILTDDFLVSFESHEKNVTTVPEVRPCYFVFWTVHFHNRRKNRPTKCTN